jgi:hypothetical protein
MQHILDHMIGPNAKYLVSNISRQMPVSQMPGKANQLARIFVPDFDDKLGRSLNLEPPSVVQLQTISIGHSNRFGKVEKNIFALICSQADAAAMARVKIESKRAGRLFLRPMACRAMNRSAMHGRYQYMK